jgi:hypothetical protein
VDRQDQAGDPAGAEDLQDAVAQGDVLGFAGVVTVHVDRVAEDGDDERTMEITAHTELPSVRWRISNAHRA